MPAAVCKGDFLLLWAQHESTNNARRPFSRKPLLLIIHPFGPKIGLAVSSRQALQFLNGLLKAKIVKPCGLPDVCGRYEEKVETHVGGHKCCLDRRYALGTARCSARNKLLAYQIRG
jgi:hypothetical protein